MSSLVQKLQTEQPVELRVLPERGMAGLKDSIARGWLQVRFTETKGGTQLGVPIDRGASDFTKADFEHGSGSIRIVGNLTLDYVRVRCIAEIDLSTLKGTGRLEPLN
jgi:hypothetical protein